MRKGVQVWPLRRPMKREDFLKLKEKKIPKEKAKRVPETIWVEMGSVVVGSGVMEIWKIFEKYKEYKKEDLILLARKADNKDWLSGEEEKERFKFFVARPGIDEDFLKKKKLFLVPDEKSLKAL